MSLKVLTIKEETKARFEKIQRALSFVNNRDLSQDEVEQALLDCYEAAQKVTA
ncbi:MAG: hypothetical protein WC325_10325 [Candidatus Bathyarchaeia archaeon]|jgi:hypothetical protein